MTGSRSRKDLAVSVAEAAGNKLRGVTCTGPAQSDTTRYGDQHMLTEHAAQLKRSMTARRLLYVTRSEPSPVQNMRVVQRNLVYVVGLALDLCHEDTLKGGDYFGQFGRIVKVCRRGAAPSLRGQPYLHKGSS